MTKLVALATLTFVLGQDPVDGSPVTETPIVGEVFSAKSVGLVALQEGHPAPFEGRLYSLELHITTANRILNLEAQVASLKESLGVPVWVVVTLAAAGILVGSAATFLVMPLVSK